MKVNYIEKDLNDYIPTDTDLFLLTNNKFKAICYYIYLNISVDSVGTYVDDLIH